MTTAPAATATGDHALASVTADGDPLGALARSVDAKGCHDIPTGIYTR